MKMNKILITTILSITLIFLMVGGVLGAFPSGSCATCSDGTNCLTDPSSLNKLPKSEAKSLNQPGKFEDNQWDIDETDGIEGNGNDKGPAKENPENWRFAKSNQADKITPQTAAGDKVNGEFIYNKYSSPDKKAEFLKERTGKRFNSQELGKTEFAHRGGKDYLKIGDTVYPLENIPSGTTNVDIINKGGKDVFIFTGPDGATGFEVGACLRKTNTPEQKRTTDRDISPRASRGDPNAGASSGAGGNMMQGIQGAMSAIQQAIGMLGPLIESLKSNGKGETNVASNNQGGSEARFSNGAAGAFVDENGNDIFLAKENEDNEKEETIIATLADGTVDITDADLLVPQQLAAKISDATNVQFGGIDGNYPGFLSEDYIENYNSITAAVISGEVIIDGKEINFGQFIKLNEHNLDFSGRNLNIYALKTFNNIEAGGQDLKLFNGEIELEIHGQSIWYPRLVRNADYGINKLSNKLDRNNQFRLQHFSNKKSQLTDYKKIVSVGDITIKHPRNPLLLISNIRKLMWKTS